VASASDVGLLRGYRSLVGSGRLSAPALHVVWRLKWSDVFAVFEVGVLKADTCFLISARYYRTGMETQRQGNLRIWDGQTRYRRKMVSRELPASA